MTNEGGPSGAEFTLENDLALQEAQD